MLTLLFPERPIYDSFIPFMKNDRTSSFIWKIKVPVKLTTVKIVNYFSAMTWREWDVVYVILESEPHRWCNG
jgi:hypothetical protein